MNTIARESRGTGAAAIGGLVFAGIVFGTLLPAYFLFQLSSQAHPSVTEAIALVVAFAVVNACAGGLVWKRAAKLGTALWRDLVRTLVIPWAMNVVLITAFLAVDLARIALS